MLESGEANILHKYISDGQIIFDVGAHVGDWTKEASKAASGLEIHLFEPNPSAYQELLKNLNYIPNQNKLIPQNLGLSCREGTKVFYHYKSLPVLSTLYRRVAVEQQGLESPEVFTILNTTLDQYCKRQKIRRINYLKIDVEGAELDVLLGAEALLKAGRIDYIQFEYGGTYLDSKKTLKQAFEYLHKFRYALFKIENNSLKYKPIFEQPDENYEYSNYLAVNERFRGNVLGEPPRLLDVPQLCQQHSVVAKGIIHVGAHEGSEVEYYRAMGAQKILFIEANPTVFERLKDNVGQYPNVQAVNYAISNVNGTITLRVTSFDQSSSILPLKHHLDIYPTIQETEQVTVPSRTLDTLLEELGLNPADFNILNIDIQGAELLALQGATHLLQYVEAINTEVNYKELYEGCALIDDLDEFLEQYDLRRVATTTPHPFWGDAFYAKKPLVTMSILSRARFGNQIFLYAMLKIHQKNYDIRVETNSWIGQYLFGHNDPLISKHLPVELDSGLSIISAKESFKNVEFGGPTYQVHTQYYAPYKDFFRSLFKPIPTIEAKLKEALQHLRERGKTIVGLHLRRGDYIEPYADFMFYAPNSCYRNWLKSLWETLESPVLFIASDNLESVLEDFTDYNPVTTKDLGIELPEACFYPDFYLLSHCDVLAISNSTFSFAAAMLNERCKFFFRPHLQSQKLIPFDPWNSEPLLWQGRGTWVESEGLDNKTGQKVNISIVESFLPDANFLLGSHVDLPSIGIQDNRDEFFLKGWAIGKESSVVGIELMSQGEVIHRTPVNQERMDITRVFPTFPGAEAAGYSTAVKLKKFPLGSTEVTIHAVFSDNSRVPIGLIKLEKISEVEQYLTQIHNLQNKLEISQKSLSELYKERWKLKRLLARNQKPSVNSNNTSKLKWFFAINSESPDFDSYSQMLKVAVQTAQRNTSLEPFCIYDGSENDVTQWLRENGVTVIHHRSPHYEQFKREFPSCHTVAAGAFLRVEIPKIVDMYGMPDEYVLYTDCDVIFQNDFVDRLNGLTCKYIAAAPEHEVDNWSYLNSGVLYMNIKNLLDINEEFNNFIKNNLDKIMKFAYDQGAYNFFFKERWERLDIDLNWKSYWPLNYNASIIHFHGPKPNQTHEIVNGTASPLKMLFVNDSYWQNTEVWQDHYQELQYNR